MPLCSIMHWKAIKAIILYHLTKAFLTFQECVDLGEEIYGASDYKNIDGIDKMF